MGTRAQTERPDDKRIDWRLTAWEGSRRDQLDRWASMSLGEILEAQEEIGALSAHLSPQATVLATAPVESADNRCAANRCGINQAGNIASARENRSSWAC